MAPAIPNVPSYACACGLSSKPEFMLSGTECPADDTVGVVAAAAAAAALAAAVAAAEPAAAFALTFVNSCIAIRISTFGVLLCARWEDRVIIVAAGVG